MTLIALIITIIVLLILAGVSISMVAGDNGILTQAVNAADSNNLAEVKSDLSLALASCQTNYFADRYGDGGSNVKIENYFTTDKIKKEMGDDYSSVEGQINIGSESTLTITKTDGKVYTAVILISDIGGVTISSVVESGTSSGDSSSNGELATTAITATNYGDTIEYSANGVTDWKIFYNDGNNVYIIASDYLDSGKVPSETGMSTSGYYVAYWDSLTVTSFTNLQSGFLFNELYSVTSTNKNYYATASLLDTSIWSSFVDSSYADYAIGSPTIEMWVASWNAKGYTPLYTAVDSTGYYVDTSDSPEEYYVDIGSSSGCEDSLYFPYTSEIDNGDGGGCTGYLLSSPSALSSACLYFAYSDVGYIGVYGEEVQYYSYAGLDSFEVDQPFFSLRPVICLSSDATVGFSDDCWTLVQ